MRILYDIFYVYVWFPLAFVIPIKCPFQIEKLAGCHNFVTCYLVAPELELHMPPWFLGQGKRSTKTKMVGFVKTVKLSGAFIVSSRRCLQIGRWACKSAFDAILSAFSTAEATPRRLRILVTIPKLLTFTWPLRESSKHRYRVEKGTDFPSSWSDDYSVWTSSIVLRSLNVLLSLVQEYIAPARENRRGCENAKGKFREELSLLLSPW